MMLKSILLGVALVAGASTLAFAQDPNARERPELRVQPPGVVIEKRDRPVVIEKQRPETTGRANCETKSVTRDGPEGSKTVTKERCD
jgi:hypothetical protein